MNKLFLQSNYSFTPLTLGNLSSDASSSTGSSVSGWFDIAPELSIIEKPKLSIFENR